MNISDMRDAVHSYHVSTQERKSAGRLGALQNINTNTTVALAGARSIALAMLVTQEKEASVEYQSLAYEVLKDWGITIPPPVRMTRLDDLQDTDATETTALVVNPLGATVYMTTATLESGDLSGFDTCVLPKTWFAGGTVLENTGRSATRDSEVFLCVCVNREANLEAGLPVHDGHYWIHEANVTGGPERNGKSVTEEAVLRWPPSAHGDNRTLAAVYKENVYNVLESGLYDQSDGVGKITVDESDELILCDSYYDARAGTWMVHLMNNANALLWLSHRQVRPGNGLTLEQR